MPDIYVVVAENDQIHISPDGSTSRDDGGEIVFETYTNGATLDRAKQNARSIVGKYGKCRIAKLQFIDETEA